VRGIYHWEQIEEYTILFETSQHQKYVRYGFDKFGIQLKENVLCNYGKFISPRNCKIESVVNALRKMDNDYYLDGCCLVDYEGFVECIPSFNCLNCYQQFKIWLYDTIELSTTYDELQYFISNCNTDEFILYFVCKHFFYLLHEFVHVKDQFVFEEFKEIMMDEKKILYAS
tara:strand:- start:1901 stop:2413 length:513 start_codon:yes stop_codon:yes gene_type:complete